MSILTTIFITSWMSLVLLSSLLFPLTLGLILLQHLQSIPVTCIFSKYVLIVLPAFSKHFEWLCTAFPIKGKCLVFRGPDPHNLISFFTSRFIFPHFSTRHYIPIAVHSAFFFPGTCVCFISVSPATQGAVPCLRERVQLQTV